MYNLTNELQEYLPNELQEYSKLGLRLFPGSSKTKSPIIKDNLNQASADPKQLLAWLQQYPGCAVGAVTSAERGVIDIDPRNGGTETLNALIAQHGPLPITPCVRTGGGGRHYWFRFPPGTRSGVVASGIDRKAEGGYVIVPPSRINCPEHAGRAYVWENPLWELPLADAPEWALAAVAKASVSNSAAGFVLGSAANDIWTVPEDHDLLTHPGVDKAKEPSASRRLTLCRLVGSHLAQGNSEANIYAMAEAWNKRNTPPMPDAEWQDHVRRLIEKERRKAVVRGESQRLTDSLFSSVTPPHSADAGSKEVKNSGEQATDEFFTSLLPSTAQETPPSQSGPNSLLTYWSETNKKREGEDDLSGSDTKSNFPTLKPEAYHGLLGQMLRAIEPETEAHPAGILLGWLTCFGSVVGRNAWFQVGARKHYPALYVGIVGRTSDAKGDSWSVSVYPFQQIEKEWCKLCIAPGIGSGEGLIERVADDQSYPDKHGVMQFVPGATDKRCLLRLPELSSVFKKGRRENASLSESLREMWDGDAINVPNRKANALSTSDYAVSMVGDITPEALCNLLRTGTEGYDGFMNRFLFTLVRRTSFLPSGGSVKVLEPFLKPLADALTSAKKAGEMKRDADAEALWQSVYPSLATTSDLVPHTDRARPYVVRLSMLYALADCSRVIKLQHLQAALAVWDYCRDSAASLFGGKQRQEQKPRPLIEQIADAIVKTPGIRRSELTMKFKNVVHADEIATALAQLEAKGMAYCTEDKADGSGRVAQCWWAGAREEEGQEEVPYRSSLSLSSCKVTSKEVKN